MILKLLTKEIPDTHIRENFQRLNDLVREQVPLLGFKFFEFNLKAGKQTVRHGLGFQPKDVIVSHVSPEATTTWHHSETTTKDLAVTASAACRVRVFLGTHR